MKQAKVSKSLIGSTEKIRCPYCKRTTSHHGGFAARNGGVQITCGAFPDGDKADCGQTFELPGQPNEHLIEKVRIDPKRKGFLGTGSIVALNITCPYCQHEMSQSPDFQEQYSAQQMRCPNCFDVFLIPMTSAHLARLQAEEESRRKAEAERQKAAAARAERNREVQRKKEAALRQDAPTASTSASNQRTLHEQQARLAAQRQQREAERRKEEIRQQEAARRRMEEMENEREAERRRRQEELDIAQELRWQEDGR